MRVSSYLFLFLLAQIETFAQNVELIYPDAVGELESIKMSPNEKYFLTSSSKTIKIWGKDGNLLHVIDNNRGWNPYFVRNGSSLIMNNEIRDANSFEVKGILPEDLGVISPDGKKSLRFFGRESEVRVFDIVNDRLVLKNVFPYSNQIGGVYTKDFKFLVTIFPHSIKVYDLTTATLLKSFDAEVPSGDPHLVAISPNGKYILCNNHFLNKSTVFDVTTGNKVFEKDVAPATRLPDNSSFSQDGQYIFFSNSKAKGEIWESATGNLVSSIELENKFLFDGEFVTNSNLLLARFSTDKIACIWEYPSGKLISKLTSCSKISISENAKNFIIYNEGKISVVDIKTENLRRVVHLSNSPQVDARLLGDGRYILTSIGNVTTARLITTGENTRTFRGQFKDASPDGKILLTIDKSRGLVWDTNSGRLLQQLSSFGNPVQITFSKNCKHLYSVSEESKKVHTKIFELESGKFRLVESPPGTFPYWSPNEEYVVQVDHSGFKYVNGFPRHEITVNNLNDDSKSFRLFKTPGGAVEFSPDGKYIALSVDNPHYRLVNVMSGVTEYPNQYLDGAGDHSLVNGFFAGSDGAFFVSTDIGNGDIYVKNIQKNEIRYKFRMQNNGGAIEHSNIDLNSLKATQNSGRSSFSIIDIVENKELLKVAILDSLNWVAIHSSGLFDASPGAMDKLYFVQGLEIIDFNQLKERYYEPGLWKKVMAGEELRNVEAFTKIELPPDIELGEVNAQGILPLKVTNRDGGIGEVSVLINGKEVIQDARPKGTDTNAQTLSLQIPMIKYASQFVPGEENYIVAKAWNGGHWVVSRGKMVKYKAPKKADIKPAIHVIACGISDYTGEEIDLKFAAKDAESVSQALRLGASKLFGTDASYIYTLTTTGTKQNFPTKANILSAFKTISATAKSTDVVVVYLAGHGITWGGQDGDFYYLTQDAYTGVSSAYNDPAIRQQTTLSSAELVELFKSIPAQKQVLIVDACGSGKAVDNLIAKRDIPTSTLRALDRMKDRTGMHIITGCAADAVSYEASQFGQGILTYSLLEGIRGAALREEKFVDVNQLFQYAQERVPVLVAGVGGIQTPQVFSPYGAQSFDIGEVSAGDKAKIPIAKIHPVFVRSSLINKNTLDDNLQLGKLVDDKLNDISSRGADAELIFVNVQEYPDGCKLSGIYEQSNGTINADIKIKCGAREKKQVITGISYDDLVGKAINLAKQSQ